MSKTTRPPKRGTKKYKAMVELGCGGRKIETLDGTEYDCDHQYPWDCDDCPPCVERQYREWELAQDEAVATPESSVFHIYGPYGLIGWGSKR